MLKQQCSPETEQTEMQMMKPFFFLNLAVNWGNQIKPPTQKNKKVPTAELYGRITPTGCMSALTERELPQEVIK